MTDIREQAARAADEYEKSELSWPVLAPIYHYEAGYLAGYAAAKAEATRALFVPAPPETEWTSTPPKESGWYWQRYVGHIKMLPGKIECEADGTLWISRALNDDERAVEWWPVPIEPPRREPR